MTPRVCYLHHRRVPNGLLWLKRSALPSKRRESGQGLIESALIFVPTFALFFGILDVSFAVALQNAFQHSAREGVRLAVTYPTSYKGTSCSTQFTCIKKAVQDNAVGFLGGTNISKVTVNYYTANDLSHPVMTCANSACTLVGTLPQTLSTGTTVNYANGPGNIVEVVISNYAWNWMVPIGGFSSGSGINLGASATDVLGGLAVGTLSPPTP